MHRKGLLVWVALLLWFSLTTMGCLTMACSAHCSASAPLSITPSPAPLPPYLPPQARLASPLPSGAHLRPYPMGGGEASSLLLLWEAIHDDIKVAPGPPHSPGPPPSPSPTPALTFTHRAFARERQNPTLPSPLP